MNADATDRGREVRAAMLPDSLRASQESFAAELSELATGFVFGQIWTRDGLAPRDRSLVTLGILIALRAEFELRVHFRIALRNGVTRAELEELIIHAAAYAGFPAANAARRIAREALAAADESADPPI